MAYHCQGKYEHRKYHEKAMKVTSHVPLEIAVIASSKDFFASSRIPVLEYMKISELETKL
jgi:predicted nucleotidyltransferase